MSISTIAAAIARLSWRTRSYLHSFCLLLIGDLCSCARSSDILPLIHIGTDLSLHHSVGLLTDGQDGRSSNRHPPPPSRPESQESPAPRRRARTPQHRSRCLC